MRHLLRCGDNKKGATHDDQRRGDHDDALGRGVAEVEAVEKLGPDIKADQVGGTVRAAPREQEHLIERFDTHHQTQQPDDNECGPKQRDGDLEQDLPFRGAVDAGRLE
jgi:hypothetical protein